MSSQLEYRRRAGVLLEFCAGALAFVAVGLYVRSTAAAPGSPTYWEGRLIAIVAVLLAGLAFLLGLAIHLAIRRRALALAIAGAGVATPAALAVTMVYPRYWDVRSGTDLSEELLVLYGMGLSLVALSLFLSVWQTTSGSLSRDGVPTRVSHELRRLAVRNDELLADSLRARGARYRTLATALAGTGVGVSLVGILLGIQGAPRAAPASTLVVLGGIGLFTGIFTYYLTPERFVTASVVTAACRSLDSVGQSLLGEQTTPVYAYVSTSGTDADVRLELRSDPVSADRETTKEEPESLRTDGRSEISINRLVPVGLSLYREVWPSPPHPEGSTQERIIHLAEALDSPLGLVNDVEATWDTDRLSVRLADSACGPIDRFDHPVPSLLACGMALETESSVIVETERLDATDFDWRVVCRRIADPSSTDPTDSSP